MVISIVFKINDYWASKISVFINNDGFCKIIFYNYFNLIDFNQKLINIDNCLIYGDNLILNKLEDSIIEISGKIKAIEKKE